MMKIVIGITNPPCKLSEGSLAVREDEAKRWEIRTSLFLIYSVPTNV